MGCVTPPPRMHACPVCGARVPETTPFRLVHAGRIYYFDRRECMEEFQRDPERYAGK